MKHKVKIEDLGIEFFSEEIIIDGTRYTIGCDEDGYSVYRNYNSENEDDIIDNKEFEALLLECGYGMKFHEGYDTWDSDWEYWVTFLKIKTIKGVQGPYYDPEGNEWYSAWNETHSNEATK